MGVIQGLDTIPVQIQTRFADILRQHLPGWSGAGEYNFRPGAVTQMASAQLGVLMQNGSHPWINNAIEKLFENLKWTSANPAQRTELLSVLVNFMYKASGQSALEKRCRSAMRERTANTIVRR